MKLFISGALMSVFVLGSTDAFAQPGKTYPKVRGASGGLYGPTQARYQYAQRYGRQWRQNDFPSNGSLMRNQGGQLGHFQHHGRNRSYGQGYPSWGYADYGNYGYTDYGVYSPYAPYYPAVVESFPVFVEPAPIDNNVLNRDQQIEDLQRLKNLIPLPKAQNLAVDVKKSNGPARQRSLHQQGLGDFNMQQRKFNKAYEHYKRAVAAAPDLPANYFRMAWALAAAGYHSSAVREIKRGLRLDPYWPLTGESLDERFGLDNEIAKNNVLLTTAQWVREDIRDPDRLFLMGALLHFNNDIDRALKFFETAGQLAGSPQYVQLFLHPQEPPKKGDAVDAGNPPADAPADPIANPAAALQPDPAKQPPSPQPEPEAVQ